MLNHPVDGDAASSLTFHLGSDAIDVVSTDADSLRWVAEFLQGAFDDERFPATSRSSVHFVVDRVRHDGLCALYSAQTTELIELFTLDGSFDTAPGFVDARRHRFVYRDGSDVFVCADERGKAVEVVAKEAGPLVRGEFMRVVREVATTSLLRRGWLPVHASAVVLDGQATLFCGPKRAGKTSLLLHALSSGASYLSNDRVFVAPGKPSVARGMPTIVSIRKGTLERFGDALARYERARFTWTRTLAECSPGVTRDDPRSANPERIPGISPRQLVDIMGTEMSATAPIARIVFPTIEPTREGFAVRVLSRDESRDRLLAGLLSPSKPTRTGAPFSASDERFEVSGELERELVLGLVDSAQAVECIVGQRAYEQTFQAMLCKG